MPTITEEEFNILLTNPAALQDAIQTFRDFGNIISNSILYIDRLITRVTNNPIILKRILTTEYEFRAFFSLAHAHSNIDAFQQTIAPFANHTEFAKLNPLQQEAHKQFVAEREHLIKTGQAFPDHITPIMQALTAEPELLDRAIASTDNLNKILEIYPQHTKTLISPIVANPLKYPCIVKKYSDITTLSRLYPDASTTDHFFTSALNNPAEHERLFVSWVEFECFYQHAKSISDPCTFQQEYSGRLNDEQFLNFPKELQDNFVTFIENRKKRLEDGLSFPDYTGPIITQLTTNFQLFQRLIIYPDQFETLIELISPQYTEKFLTAVLSDQQYFNHLMTLKSHLTLYILGTLIKIITSLNIINNIVIKKEKGEPVDNNEPLDAFKQNMVAKLVADRQDKKCLFPDYADLLVARLRALTLEQYRTVIPSASLLILIADTLQKQADIKPCISAMLTDPAEFKRLVANKKQLKKLAKLYPKIEILQSKTIAEVVGKIEEYMKVKHNAGFVRLGARENDCPFSRLSPFLLFKIVEETADKEKTDPKTLAAVIEKAVKEPAVKPIAPKI